MLFSPSGILAVSLAHGFACADVADVGAHVLVVADGDADLAARTAESFGRSFFERRGQVNGHYPDLDTALGLAEGIVGGPVVLADMGNNSGAGAPGDATFVLREMLDRGIGNAALGFIWDPMVVRICRDAGADLSLRIGGKTSPFSGAPVDLNTRVKGIAGGLGQHLGPQGRQDGLLVHERDYEAICGSM